MNVILVREKRLRDGYTQEEDSDVRMDVDASTSQGTPKISGKHQKLEKAGFSPTEFRRSMAPSVPGLQTCSLQNYETINFCCPKPPSCSTLLWKPSKMNTVPTSHNRKT